MAPLFKSLQNNLYNIKGKKTMIVYLICYASSYLFARSGHYYMSGVVLMLTALYLYCYDYRKSRNMIHLRALFSLFWIGGQGISCLKLSHLQTDWSLMTWICFLAAYLGFFITFEFLTWWKGEPNHSDIKWRGFSGNQIPVLQSMAAVTLVSLLAFVTEAVLLGFIPLLVRGVPHAYSAFHITGLHYFTVSCVLVPSLSVVYFCNHHRRGTGGDLAVLLMDAVCLAIPILCVSRFQLILAVAMAVFTYIAMQKRLRPVVAVGVLACLVPLYLLLTIARSHDVSYLNGIFEMKNSRMPIFVTQPYMYIANNYDNFNCLVEQLPAHTFGLRMLFPLWALTGLKFLKPELVAFPIFVTKKELTTVTLFYDAYYDFGLVGVILFSCLLGAAAYLLVGQLKNTRNPIGYLFYVQIALYLVFSFFTTWFSNPATWFYLAVTTLIYIYCYWKTG